MGSRFGPSSLSPSSILPESYSSISFGKRTPVSLRRNEETLGSVDQGPIPNSVKVYRRVNRVYRELVGPNQYLVNRRPKRGVG